MSVDSDSMGVELRRAGQTKCEAHPSWSAHMLRQPGDAHREPPRARAGSGLLDRAPVPQGAWPSAAPAAPSTQHRWPSVARRAWRCAASKPNASAVCGTGTTIMSEWAGCYRARRSGAVGIRMMPPAGVVEQLVVIGGRPLTHVELRQRCESGATCASRDSSSGNSPAASRSARVRPALPRTRDRGSGPTARPCAGRLRAHRGPRGSHRAPL